jgi:uncharacterized membrane protein
VKLFQIEEPDGGPVDSATGGAAIGVDASGAVVEVAFSVGGNALVLADREGFEQVLRVPSRAAEQTEWQAVLEAARIRAERALARPVTYAVIVLADVSDAETTLRIRSAAEGSGFQVLRIAAAAELSDPTTALAAAMFAEDLVPPPERGG